MLITNSEQLKMFFADQRIWQGIPSIEVTKKGRIFVTFYGGGTREEIGNYAMVIMSEDGVNYTAGLPVVRTSPDHGTAYEMAGRDIADPRSMKAAIYAAIDIFNRREAYDDLVDNRMTIKAPDTEIKPKGGRIIE